MKNNLLILRSQTQIKLIKRKATNIRKNDPTFFLSCFKSKVISKITLKFITQTFLAGRVFEAPAF